MLSLVKLQRVAFGSEPIVGFSETEIPGVVMESPAKEAAKQSAIFFSRLRKESARPVEVVDVCTRGDEVQVDAVPRNGGSEAPVFSRIFFRREVSAATPRLVAHAPVLHAKRIATRHLTARA